MNYIDCGKILTPKAIKKTVCFWAENSYQHIEVLLATADKKIIVIPMRMEKKLKELYETFKTISEECEKSDNRKTIILLAGAFLNENKNFINILERMKSEVAGGYPPVFMNVYHYICEQKYVNAILSRPAVQTDNLINISFTPFSDNDLKCVYNHIYFWCIIASIHPGILLGNSVFERIIPVETKNDLMEYRLKFNLIAYDLSRLERPLKKDEISNIYNDFYNLNKCFLTMLSSIMKGDSSVIDVHFAKILPDSFYDSVNHMIGEHIYVENLKKDFDRILK